jgi:DNA-binding NtrC family response regulator
VPQMTGDKLAQKLIEIRPDIPIIISTGFSVKMDEDEAKEMGIRAVAMKPLEMRTLAVTVRKVLDEK